MDVQSPEFPLTVALHEQKRLVPVPHHYLKDLTVLRARQDPVRLPAYTTDREACRGREGEGRLRDGERAKKNKEKEKEKETERGKDF